MPYSRRSAETCGAADARLLDELQLLAHGSLIFPGHAALKPVSDVLSRFSSAMSWYRTDSPRTTSWDKLFEVAEAQSGLFTAEQADAAAVESRAGRPTTFIVEEMAERTRRRRA